MSIRIAFTPGEPAGIGPDLCGDLARWDLDAEIIVIADPDLIRQRVVVPGSGLQLKEYDPACQVAPKRRGELTLLPLHLRQPSLPGELNPANADYVLNTLRRATEGCLQGEFQAMVTGPVHKGIINDAGHPFTGHTEFLAALTGGTPVMMLATPELRVALVTTHLPLSQVSRAITPQHLESIIRILQHDLITRFGIKQPQILVCGLNPHAGEGGHLGHEEIEIIEPVLERLRQEGMSLTGPLPADTLFTPNYLQRADAVLAMYHDQGLPVLKHLGFGRAVNITLGLPIIRTSVDHGTALDLAGSNKFDSGSLRAALQNAIHMAQENDT